ncbi:MAG: hypothetical protein QM760_13100 [Nibricoccus sp.]
MIPRQLRFAFGVFAFVLVFNASPLTAKEDLDPETKLSVMTGLINVKPGMSLTQVAGITWVNQYLVEEYTPERLVVNLRMNRDAFLPYRAEFLFKDGKLTGISKTERDVPPDFEKARRQDLDDRPWFSVDRAIHGYYFKLPLNWPRLFEKEFKTPSFTFQLTVLGLPKIYDSKVDQWIENSLQWCVFEKPAPYTSVEEVIDHEEQRLKKMGTAIVERKPAGAAHAFVYRSTYNGLSYVGKTYYFVFDGRGYAVRFNATEGTYETNLVRFERFISEFRLTSEPMQDADVALVRDGEIIIETVGGFDPGKQGDVRREFYRPVK